MTALSLIPRLRRYALPSGSAPVAATLAILFCVVAIVCGILGPSIAPFAPDGSDYTAMMTPPAWLADGSWLHPLGTDQLGRDVLSRLIVGTRIALMVAFVTAIGAGFIGVTIGLIAGYFGGWIDALLSRIVDAFLALPFILMALAFISALGTGIGNILLVMVLTNWAQYARLVRAEVIGINGRPFVTLARMSGLPAWRIILRHILPNAMTSIIVIAILDVGRAVMLESSLSFLGLGVQPPDVSWGVMLADGRAYITLAWWLTVLPGLAIVATVLSFNTLGQIVRRRLDPREAV